MQTDSRVELEASVQSPEIALSPECVVGEHVAEQRQPLLAATHEWLHRLHALRQAPPPWQSIDGPIDVHRDRWDIEEVRTWLDLAFETTNLLHTHITTVADSLDIAETYKPDSPEHDSYVLEAVDTFNGDVRSALGGCIPVNRIAQILDECLADSVLEELEFTVPSIHDMVEQGRKNGEELDQILLNIMLRMPDIIHEAVQILKEEYSRQGRMTEYYSAVQPLKSALKVIGVTMPKPRGEMGLDRVSRGVGIDAKAKQNEQSIAVHRMLAEQIGAHDVIALFDHLDHYQTDYANLIDYLHDTHADDATRLRQLAIKQAELFDRITSTATRLREAIVAKIYANGEAAIAESYANLPEAIKGFVCRCLARGTQTPTSPEIDATATEIIDGGQRIQDFLDAKTLVEGHFRMLERQGARYTSAAMRDKIEHGARVEKTIFTLIGAAAGRWDQVINGEQVKATLSLEQRQAATEKFNDLLQGVFPGVRYATDQLRD